MPRTWLPSRGGMWVASQTSQHWPGEGSIVSGHRGQVSSLRTVVFCVLGHGRGTALPVRGRGLSQPCAQQLASCHLPLSIPVMGLAPCLSPCPDNHQPEAPAPACLVLLTSEGGDTAPIHQSPRQIRATSFLSGKPLKTPECCWCVSGLCCCSRCPCHIL